MTVAVAYCVVAVGGCTTGAHSDGARPTSPAADSVGASPSPSASTVAPPPDTSSANPTWEKPAPTTSDRDLPLSASAASAAGLACVRPSEAVVEWMRSSFRADLAASDVTMVEVGPGNDPNETWWVAAAVSYSDAWGPSAYNPVSFLTTAPAAGSAGKWISVGRALMAPKGSTDWSGVSWTGDKRVRGQLAQALALSCLPG